MNSAMLIEYIVTDPSLTKENQIDICMFRILSDDMTFPCISKSDYARKMVYDLDKGMQISIEAFITDDCELLIQHYHILNKLS